MIKGKLVSLAATVLAGVCFINSYALAGDDKPKQPADAAGGMDPAMMERWMKYATPGPHHKALEAMAGDFKYHNKFRMAPDAPWMEADGDYHGEMALGGRYLVTSVKGPMMGETFDGMGCVGFDNNSNKHFMAWIDNMGTGLMKAEGTCANDCKTITFEGKQDDPMTGKKDQAYKIEYQIKGPDAFTMSFWSPDQTGQMFESMTIEYTRVK